MIERLESTDWICDNSDLVAERLMEQQAWPLVRAVEAFIREPRNCLVLARFNDQVRNNEACWLESLDDGDINPAPLIKMLYDADGEPANLQNLTKNQLAALYCLAEAVGEHLMALFEEFVQ